MQGSGGAGLDGAGAEVKRTIMDLYTRTASLKARMQATSAKR